MVTNESYLRLKSLLLGTRKQMKRLASTDHWLKINEKVRAALISCFKELSDEQIAGIIGFSSECIQQWRQQYETVTELKRRVRNCKRPNGKVNTMVIRPDVCALARLVSPIIVAKELGVGRSSVYGWLKENWDQVDIPDPLLVPPEQLSQSHAKDDERSIESNCEARQLEEYLARHQGTVRRKYSLSEKKLILALIENNIFYNQPGGLVNVIGNTVNITVDYNLAYNSDGSTPRCIKWGDYDTCKPASHNKWNINPKFVNPVSNDFRLQSDSPAIDAGVAVSSVVLDYAGVSRPQGSSYDIGAYEYKAVSNLPLAAPTGLTLK